MNIIRWSRWHNLSYRWALFWAGEIQGYQWRTGSDLCWNVWILRHIGIYFSSKRCAASSVQQTLVYWTPSVISYQLPIRLQKSHLLLVEDTINLDWLCAWLDYKLNRYLFPSQCTIPILLSTQPVTLTKTRKLENILKANNDIAISDLKLDWKNKLKNRT